MAGAAAAEVSTAEDLVVSTVVDFTAVDLAGFTEGDFAGIDFTITGFSSEERLQIRGGAIIRTTAITTIANSTPHRPGITAPIRQAITPM